MSNRVQAIERSIGILMALADGARTLTDVTRATGLSKGTAFRLLASLNHEQLVVKDPVANAYLLGPGVLRLFHGVMGELGSLSMLARPSLQVLWEECRETVALHVRVGSERICMAELPGPQSIRYVSGVGTSVPLYVGSAGKVLLAFLPPAALDRTLAALQTGSAELDVDGLRRELATIARHGYAMSAGERIKGASAISVPVRSNGDPIAGVSILGPSDRLTRRARLAFLPELRRRAEAIEATLTSDIAARQTT